MPNNRSQAEHCATQLKRRLIKNPQLQEDYKAFVEEIFQVFNLVSEIFHLFNVVMGNRDWLCHWCAETLRYTLEKHHQFSIVASANYWLTGRM